MDHPAFAEVEKAVRELRSTRGWPDAIARFAVRVEVQVNEAPVLMMCLPGAVAHECSDPEFVGTMKIEGVDYYVVPRLPAPGWRLRTPPVR